MKSLSTVHLILTLLISGLTLFAKPAFANRNNVSFWKAGFSPYTWVGKGGDANWNTAANWSGGVVPGSSNIAVFDDDNKTLCRTNCSPTINLSISVKGVQIRAGYKGTITQGAGFTVTVGSSGWSQNGGTFTGSNADVTCNGPVDLTAGTFNAPSANFSANTTYSISGSAVFNAGTGTLVFNPSWSSSTVRYITAGTGNYNNVTFIGNETTFEISDTLTVLGTLTIGDPGTYGRNINVGTISAKGAVNVVNRGFRGSATLKISGSTSQTITAISAAPISNFEIASTGGTVSFSGDFVFMNNFTYTSGTVDVGTATVTFKPEWNTAQTVKPGTIAFKDVTWIGWDTTYTLVGTMTVNGTLSFSDSSSSAINGGTFMANGNVVFSGYGDAGTSNLTFGGSSSTTLTISGGYRLKGTITVNKTGGASVTLATNAQFNGTSQNVTVAAGVLDLAGFTLNVQNVFTISTPGTLKCNGGTYTKTSMIVDGDIDCAAYGFNWTGAGANANWSTAANWSGGVAPTSSSTVVFKDTYCTTKCNSTVSANANVRGVRLYSAYTGTITQNTGVTLTLGAAGWSQADGTFTGGNSAIDFSGPLKISGGTFNSTSGQLTMNSGDVTFSGGTFNAGTGSFAFGGATYNITPGSANFNIVKLIGFGGVHNIIGTMSVKDLIVNLQYSSTLNTGTMAISGNITITGGSQKELSGTGSVKLVGNSSGQTITSTAGGGLPQVEIATGTYPVTLSGTMTFYGNFKITSVGTLTVTGSNVGFFVGCGGTQSIDTGGVPFNNVTFTAVCATTSIVGTFKAAGNVQLSPSYSCGFNNGTVEVGGNLNANYDSGPYAGTTLFKMTGNPAGQTVSQTNGGYIPKLEIDAGTNNVTLSGTVNVGNGYKLTSVGTLTTTGSTLVLGTPSYATVSIEPGNATYNDVQIFGVIGTSNVVGTMLIDGNLTLNGSYSEVVNGGTLSVKGNVTVINSFSGGTTSLILRGNSPSVTVTGGALPSGNVTVSLASGILTLGSNVSWNNTGQTVNVTSGDIDMAGKNLTIKALTLNGRTITKNGGVLTVNGSATANGTFYGGTIAP